MVKQHREKIRGKEFVKFLFLCLLTAFAIRSTVLYPFTIPTPSMEKTLLVGDFMIANRFVYGIRSPDWIGIPRTKIGFKIPFFKTEGLREPEQGDMVIFKNPRDVSENWIKRCIAVSGDTVEIYGRQVFVNGELYADPSGVHYKRNSLLSNDLQQADIYPPKAGNIHYYGPIRVPAPGDIINFYETSRDEWYKWFQMIIYEGNRITIKIDNQDFDLNIDNQNDWLNYIHNFSLTAFFINGRKFSECGYTIKNRHYFLMGDNRDNSCDSRFFGFLPERYIVGEPLIIILSIDKKIQLYRIFNKIRWNRFLLLTGNL